MRVFVYEHVIGGGMLADDDRIPEGLLREGAAMHRALVDDLASLDRVRVETTLDARVAKGHTLAAATDVESAVAHDHETALHDFDRLCGSCDWTLVVAPEIDGALAERTDRVRHAGGRLLGLSDETIAVSSDKHASAELLVRSGVPCVPGIRHVGGDSPPAGLMYPALAKPCQGAGCEGIVILRSENDWRNIGNKAAYRIEPIVTGTSVSATVLCGPGGAIPLLAGRQDVRIADHVTYHGGSLPCRHTEGARALALTERTVAALPRPLGVGLLGIDMILGDNPDGSDDTVVEVNPRVTTSYVALRRLSVGNLARAMLDMAAGMTPQLAFDTVDVTFTPTGDVRETAPDLATSQCSHD